MDPALAKLFMLQHGVVTTAQALAHGETYETIGRRVAHNDWTRPLPRIVTPVGVEATFAGRLSAAALSIGAPLAFAGQTAAAIWEFPGFGPPPRLHVVVDDTRQAGSTPDIYVQRRSALLERTFDRAGWPVVSVEAALLGSAPDLSFVQLVDTAQDLLRLRRTTTSRLDAVRGRGIKGSAMLAAALDIAGDGLGSKWERRLARHMMSTGRPKPEPQWRVESPEGLIAYVDLAFPALRLAVEIDGYIAHSRPAAFRYDRHRQNALVVELGWTILRYTPYEIAKTPERLVKQIWRCYDRLNSPAA